ncbi:OTU domain-containing protein 4 isoform X2 [Acipenser ruthenus]|uniref:OTU domain-containing protein 4 isoform X2 n=1 Tax=Acipenser ruthenus TaxID=7906 RepID=UPI002741DA9E|nr:OTU domain-containing protein 4 isoform X2 [Acipenser ruthenus]
MDTCLQHDRVSNDCMKNEKLMDEYLRSQGLYRKEIAKDGSCLFRAVAEQILHCQNRHLEVRHSCASYLRRNRSKYEAFIEGTFEEYLKRLENPQIWVGEVEISALSLIYKHDFLIYQEPGKPPVNITENNFPDKVSLCFLNGNHYDSVYPKQFTEAAALCQSIVYELLYEKVLGVDSSKQTSSLQSCSESDQDAREECDSSDESDLDAGDAYWTEGAAESADMNTFRSRYNKQAPKDSSPASAPLSRRVLQSLDPAVYRNVEFDVWLKSKRAQQKMDYFIAAGMQYTTGDKCKVRLEPSGRFYKAYIQEVSHDDGPVVVFVEELGAKYSIPLKNLRPPSEESPASGWSTVAEKKAKRPGPVTEQNLHSDAADYRGVKQPTKATKPRPAGPPKHQQAVPTRASQHSGPAGQAPHSPTEQKQGSRTSPQTARKCDLDPGFSCTPAENRYFGLSPGERKAKEAKEQLRALFEIQHRDEQAFPALGNQNVCQTATQSSDANNPKKTQSTEKQPSRRRVESQEPREKDPKNQRVKQGLKVEQNKSQITNVGEKYQKAVSPSEPTKAQNPISTLQDFSNPGPTGPAPVAPDRSQPPISFSSPCLPADPPPYEAATCCQTGISPVPNAPTMVPSPMMSQGNVMTAPNAPLPVPLPATGQPSVPLSEVFALYQDLLYPGFPCNEKGEGVPAPLYSYCKNGDDLPNDKCILRFFFNLGLKAYSCPMWPPHSYLYPLHQAHYNACAMQPKMPGPASYATAWFPEGTAANQSVNSTPANCTMPIQDHRDPPLPAAGRAHGQCEQTDNATQPPPTPPPATVVTPSPDGEPCSDVNYCVESLPYSSNNQMPTMPLPLVHMGGLQWPTYGPNVLLGRYPVTPSMYPPFHLGYPIQEFPVGNPTAEEYFEVSPADEEERASPVVENLAIKDSGHNVSTVQSEGGLGEPKKEVHFQKPLPPATSAAEERAHQVLSSKELPLDKSKQGVDSVAEPPSAQPVSETETGAATKAVYSPVQLVAGSTPPLFTFGQTSLDREWVTNERGSSGRKGADPKDVAIEQETGNPLHGSHLVKEHLQYEGDHVGATWSKSRSYYNRSFKDRKRFDDRWTADRREYRGRGSRDGRVYRDPEFAEEKFDHQNSGHTVNVDKRGHYKRARGYRRERGHNQHCNEDWSYRGKYRRKMEEPEDLDPDAPV